MYLNHVENIRVKFRMRHQPHWDIFKSMNTSTAKVHRPAAARSGGRPAQISRDIILEHARQVPAHELTMPVIARRLGVKPAALYYHFASRDALLAALGAHLVTELKLRPPDPARWRAWLLATATDLHRFLSDNPVILALEDWSQLNRIGLPLIENMLSTLEDAGFSMMEAMHVWSVLANYAYSNARILNDATRFSAANWKDLQAEARTQVGADLPRTRALLDATGQIDPAAYFQQSLRWLIASLPAPPARSTKRARQ